MAAITFITAILTAYSEVPMQTKLLQLSSQLSDVMHQAEFMANWVRDNRLNRQQMENEFNILIAEIWDSQEQVNTLLKQTQTTTQAGMI